MFSQLWKGMMLKGKLQPNRNRRSWLRWVGTGLATVLFIWLISQQDLGAIWQAIRSLSLITILGAMGLFYFGQFWNALRWKILLHARGASVSTAYAFKLVLTGAFVSNFLPSTIGGDAIRMVGIQQKIDDRGLSIASVIVDRTLNLAAMITLLPLGLGALRTMLGGVPYNVLFATTPTLLLTSEREESRSLGKRLRVLIDPTRDSIGLWLSDPLTLLLALVISWVSILVVFFAVWLLALDLGMTVSFLEVLVVSVVTYLITLLPISLNGYGVREFAVTALYVGLGQSLELAVSLALVTRLLRLLETLPGAYWLPQLVPDNDDDRQGAQE